VTPPASVGRRIRVRVSLACGHEFDETRPAGLALPGRGELRACSKPEHLGQMFTATYGQLEFLDDAAPPLPTPQNAAGLAQIGHSAPRHATILDGGFPYDLRPIAVAAYPATHPGGSGADVVVFVQRLPAMFYEIHCPAKNVHLSTGTDCEDLVHAIAIALAGGDLRAAKPAETGPAGADGSDQERKTSAVQ
jgi:hypothetical protein